MILLLFIFNPTLIGCHETIFSAIDNYIVENNISYYDLFNKYDKNNDKCIDDIEMNTLMKEVGVAWRCQWPKKVIEYFTHNNCITWEEIKFQR